MPKYRIGIIGCGWIAPFHVQALNQLKDQAQVLWVCDPEIERAKNIARRFPENQVQPVSSYHEHLGEVDAVFILVPHHLHYPIAMQALDAGCHVLLEKPLALNLKEADEMIAKADQHGKLLMIALPYRYRKSTVEFKRLIESGRYGRLFWLDAVMEADLREYVSGWITKKSTLGGGVFFSASAHMLDVMLWIAGDVETLSMVGAHGGLKMEGEDTALCIIKFKNGVVGSTRQTWFSPKPGDWYAIKAYCERGVLSLTVNPLGNVTTDGHRCPWNSRIEASGIQNEVLLNTSEGHDLSEEVGHFFHCLDTGETCQTDGRTARKLMAIIVDAYARAEKDGGL